MEILEKFNTINSQIYKLERERRKLVNEAKSLKSEILHYLKDQNNPLEERFIVYQSLPEEMLEERFSLYSENPPKGFERFTERLISSFAEDLIEDVPSWFGTHFDYEKKEINYKGFSNEFIGRHYEGKEEERQVIREAYNFAIINLIGSIY